MSQEHRYCEDCAWYRPRFIDDADCANPSYGANLVSREKSEVKAWLMRVRSYACGVEGKLYEPRTNHSKTPKTRSDIDAA